MIVLVSVRLRNLLEKDGAAFDKDEADSRPLVQILHVLYRYVRLLQ